MASIQKIVNKKGVVAWRVQIELRGRRAYKTFPVKNLAVAWANQRESEIIQGKVQSSSVAEQTPFLKPVRELLDSVQCQAEDKTATLTGTYRGDPAALMIVPVGMLERKTSAPLR